jgi:DNA-binding transcriptional ArsR family regulator
MIHDGNPAAFAAIADPTRRRILSLLVDQPRDVEALASRFPVSRPAISKHLAVLLKARLVTRRAVGRSNLYALDPEPLEAVRAWLDGFWAARLATLKRLAEGDS